jgi:hypothetical protein
LFITFISNNLIILEIRWMVWKIDYFNPIK